MADYDKQSPEEQKLIEMGRQALERGLVRAVFTSNEDGSTGGHARLLVVTADTPASALNSIKTRAAILDEDGHMSRWNLLLAFPKWGDWYPIKGAGAAEEKKSRGGAKRRWGSG